MKDAPALAPSAQSQDPAETTGAHWDHVAALWLESGAQEIWRRHSDAVNLRLLDRWFPPSVRRVLKTDLWDEAVGAGLYPALAARSQSVVGVDVSGTIAAAAGARYAALATMRADVRRLPFEDESFDAVVSNSTLDHFRSVDDIAKALVELRRVLRADGTIILTLDNPTNPLVALRGLLPRSAFDAVWSRHGELAARIAPDSLGATCGTSTLERLVSAAGFRVSDRGAIMHCPRVLAVVISDQLQRHASAAAAERFLHALLLFEVLERLPTRFFTGHFVAIRAIR